MSRFDISRLRKEKGISQGELANLLQITQSFLSAIENGKSPLPVEKEERLCEIFNLRNLNDYEFSRKDTEHEKNLEEMTDSDLFNQLLNRFHRQAHSSEQEHHHHDHHQQIEELKNKLDDLFTRNDMLFSNNQSLMQRNDRLSADNDKLRAEIDNYRSEIDRLRQEIYSLRLKSKP